MSKTSKSVSVDVISNTRQRRRWTPSEKKSMVEETYHPGSPVSLIARNHGIPASQLFTWRRQYEEGALKGVETQERLVPESKYKKLAERVRRLERILGQKTVEVEILKEAVRIGREKKLISRAPLRKDFSYAGLNSYVETRATAFTTELSERELSWPVPYSETASCSSELGDFEAHFFTSWLGDIKPTTPGGAMGSATFTYNGELIKLESAYSLAGISASVIRPQPTVTLMGKSGETNYLVNIFVEKDLF